MMSNLLNRMRQWWCGPDHACYLADLKRVSETRVECECFRCGKRLVATYGLALPCQWHPRQRRHQ